MKKTIVTLMVLLIAVLFAACGSTPTQVDLTGVTSYYVRANGSDSNAGTSEDAPFRTLAKALQIASNTSVKKITVIGVLDGSMTTEDAEKVKPSSVRNIIKSMDATGGQDIGQVITSNIGVAQIGGSYDEPNPQEILITGKPDASAGEKAVLTTRTGCPLQILNTAIRLENIEISGCQDRRWAAILVARGDLTLARGARITGNSCLVAVYVHNGTVILRDNAEISNNESRDNVGIYFENGSVGIMLDNSTVTNNKASNNGGGIALSGSTLIMEGNSSVSGNSAGNGGGGIITFTDTANGYISRIIITDNASVTKNSAKLGGGILLQDQLYLRGNARITENTATTEGGGIYGITDNALISKGENVIISDNHAPSVPNINFTFD